MHALSRTYARPTWAVWVAAAVFVAVCTVGAIVGRVHAGNHEPVPPRAVAAAIASGRTCWLETDYVIRHGALYAPRSEWLCK